MTEPLVSIRDLSHSYGDGALKKEVLHGINVDFYPGEIVIIMGPSGGGKTTLLSLAGALRRIQSGSIHLDGVQLRGASARTLMQARRRVGFVFQAHNLIDSLTIRENVQMALALDPGATIQTSRRQATDLLTRVGLAEHTAKRPRQLSGGQKQRVAIARALVRWPRIIMADEPTAALDRQSGREVVDLLKHLAHELHCAVLLVTHDNRILDIADRILTLEDGVIEESSLALDRLSGEVTAAMELLPDYPSHLGSNSLAGLRARFSERLNAAASQLAALVARRQSPALAARSESWAQSAEDLRYLEDSLGQMQSLGVTAEDPHGLHDAVVQSLDFLLRTAAQAMRSRSPHDAEVLASLTANHSQAQSTIRQQYEGLHRPAGTLSDDPALDLVSIYFRCVYFLSRIAARLNHEFRPYAAEDL